MIGPALLEKLVAVYARWLDEDELGMPVRVSHDELPDLTVTSVREFLEELIRAASGTDAVIELPVALKHPDSTFGQLLASSLVTHLGPPVPVESMARLRLCAHYSQQSSTFVTSGRGRPGTLLLLLGKTLRPGPARDDCVPARRCEPERTVAARSRHLGPPGRVCQHRQDLELAT